MADHTQIFNSAVIASVYTGYIMIPPDVEPRLYDDVKPLRLLMAQKAGLQEEDCLERGYRNVVRQQMRQIFPNLQDFKNEVDDYFKAGGKDVSREEAWPHIKRLADEIIGDCTVEL